MNFVGKIVSAKHEEFYLLKKLADRAAVLVIDQIATPESFRIESTVAAALTIPVVTVDASCLVPSGAFPKLISSTPEFRRQHKSLRQDILKEHFDLKTKYASS